MTDPHLDDGASVHAHPQLTSELTSEPASGFVSDISPDSSDQSHPDDDGLAAPIEPRHDEVRSRLSDFLDRGLSTAEEKRIQKHLQTCADCRAFFNTLRGTIDLLGRLGPRPAPRPLKNRLLDNVRSVSPRR